MRWITAPLGEITTVLSGTTPDSSNPRYWNGHHVWVTPTDLGSLRGHVIDTSARKISDEGMTSCGLPLVPRGAVVMSSRAPIGHLAIAGCDLYTNQGCKSFVCGNQLEPWFLFFMLKHRMPDIQALGSGATFVEVSKSALEKFEVRYPASIDAQRRIATRLKTQLAEVETARQAAQAQLHEIEALPARLLAQAFGEA
jgi:type I restriction enzyme S subunit